LPFPPSPLIITTASLAFPSPMSARPAKTVPRVYVLISFNICDWVIRFRSFLCCFSPSLPLPPFAAHVMYSPLTFHLSGLAVIDHGFDRLGSSPFPRLMLLLLSHCRLNPQSPSLPYYPVVPAHLPFSATPSHKGPNSFRGAPQLQIFPVPIDFPRFLSYFLILSILPLSLLFRQLFFSCDEFS